MEAGRAIPAPAALNNAPNTSGSLAPNASRSVAYNCSRSVAPNAPKPFANNASRSHAPNAPRSHAPNAPIAHAPNTPRAAASNASRAQVSNAPITNASRAQASNAPITNASRVQAPNAHNAPNTPGPANSPRGKQKQKENNVNVVDKLKVHVSGFPPYTQAVDLVRTFSKIGAAQVGKLNPRMSSAVLTFSTEAEAKAAIQASKKVNVYGEFLLVRQLTARDSKPPPHKRDFIKSKQKAVIVEPKDIDLSGDFEQQVDILLAAVRLTQEEALAVSALYADLERVLWTVWPGCQAIPFGSITTGLGIKTSDADCYLHVPGVSPHAHHSFVQRAKRALQAHPQTFAELLAIPRANTPIIKFFHVPTQTNCDLSFKTPLGTRNSLLVKFLLLADPRLLPLAVTVKYWARVHGISGTGKLTNYALAMMIVFYLQRPPREILPSVESLQRDPSDDVIVDHWNTGFADRRLPTNSDESSLSELLGGFFEYYANFDFEELAVCPYLGAPIRKDAFVDVTRLPKEFERYRANVSTQKTLPLRATTALCVQDPFEQCHNVASAVSAKLASDIKAYFKFAADAYEKEKPNECRDFLKTILMQKPKIVRGKTHPEYRINLHPKALSGIVKPDWKSVVRETVFALFETMLKINLMKVEEHIDPNAKKEKERYMGTMTKAIWRRKQFTRLYGPMKLDFIQKQARITEEILAVELEIFLVAFQVTLKFSQNPRNAIISIKFIDGALDPFREFGKFYVSIMHNWLMTILTPYKKPSLPDTPAKIEEIIKSIDAKNDLDSDDDEVTPETSECVDNEEDTAECGDDDTEGPKNDTLEGVDDDVSESTDEDIAAAGRVSNDRGDDKGAPSDKKAQLTTPAETALASEAHAKTPAADGNSANTPITISSNLAKTDSQTKS